MKYRLLFSLILSFSTFYSVTAQDEDVHKKIQKLREIYEEGEWLKLDYKCYTMAEDEVFKREPLVWLYWSIASYEISKMENADEYPDADKDAVKFAIKFVQKDKDGTFHDEGAKHVETIVNLVQAQADAFYAEANFKKAKLQYKYLTKLQPADHLAWFKKAACEKQLKAVSQARSTMQKALAIEGATEAYNKLDAPTKALLKPEYDLLATDANGTTNGNGDEQP